MKLLTEFPSKNWYEQSLRQVQLKSREQQTLNCGECDFCWWPHVLSGRCTTHQTVLETL